MFRVKRTPDELEDLFAKAMEEEGKFPGMSYTDGVKATIDWLIGVSKFNPMED